MTPAERNFQAVWDAAAEVLVSYHFTIDRRDRRAAEIRTRPMAGKYFFEWWRRDTVGLDQGLESTIQPIYREVTVQIRPSGEGKYEPVVSVTVSRLLTVGDNVRNSREAFDMLVIPGRRRREDISITRSDPSRDKLGKRSSGDEALANRIADKIRRIAAEKLADKPPSAGRRIMEFLGG